MSRGAGNIYSGERGPWFVYIIYEEGGEDGPVKIGTAVNVEYRINSMRAGNWRRLMVARTFAVRSRSLALRIEREALSQLSDCRIPTRDWVDCHIDRAAWIIEEITRGIEGVSQ